MKRFLKWVLYIIVALMVIGYFVGNDKKPTTQSSPATESAEPAAVAASPKQTPSQKEVFKTTASKLFNLYEENEVAADEQMKGQLIQVSGAVDSIDKDFTDSIIVRLKTANEFMPASMEVEDSEKSKALKLKKGNKIVITCEKMSRVMGSPSGRDCIIN